MRSSGVMLAAAILTAASLSANASQFREGVIAIAGSDGRDRLSFALVECNGKLMFEIGKSNSLIAIRWQQDGSIRVGLNSNRATLMLFKDGRLVNPKGKLLHWRLLPVERLSDKPKQRFAKAKQKCR